MQEMGVEGVPLSHFGTTSRGICLTQVEPG